ncbi:MAG: type II secretion system protein GspG [Phycisphaerales bacterium JB063]
MFTLSATHFRSLIACALGGALLLSHPSGASAQEPEGFESSGPWTRTVVGEHDTVRLDIATRLLVPAEGDGPTIVLVGAVHVGDASYYTALQSILDAQDLVLYEGVGGPGEADIEPGSDADKALRTDRRLRFLASMVERYARQVGEAPAALAMLLASSDEVFDAALMRKLRVASHDAWGRAVAVEVDGNAAITAVTSYGADGEAGGEGVDADLRYEVELDQDAGTPSLYDTIASVMGLSFQGERILTDQPTWVNSDMAWDDVAAELGEGDDVTRALLEGLLNGEDPNVVMVMKGMEQFLNASPMMRTMAKLMLVRTLGQPDAVQSTGNALGEGFDRVIIDLRNQVVIDDLKALLDEGTEHETIAVFYGAGHMADMERRAFDQLGYRVAGGFWLPAVTLDLTREGLSERELGLIRRQLGQ